MFLTVQVFIKTYPYKYPEERGVWGVLPQKNCKKIGTKSCNSTLYNSCTHATRGYITVHLWIMYNLIAGIKWLVFEKPGIWMHLILVGFVEELIEICAQMF